LNLIWENFLDAGVFSRALIPDKVGANERKKIECNCLGAPILRQKIGIFVYVEATIFEA